MTLYKKIQNSTRTLRLHLSMGSRKAARESQNIKFDDKFYRFYYSDVRNLGTTKALFAYYIKIGKLKGHYPNSDALISSLEEKFGRLPPFFDVFGYRNLNQDLSFMSEGWQLKEHYLRHGRIEGRSYVSAPQSWDSDFQNLKAARSNCSPEVALEQQFHSFDNMLSASGLKFGQWLNRFMLYEFTLLNSEWLPFKPSSPLEGIVLFLQHGVQRLAPISIDAQFDINFYRQHFAKSLREVSDEDLYKDWLCRGLEAGEACSQQAALHQMIGSNTFPSCFNTDVYRSILPRRNRRQISDRFSALVHFVGSGFDQFAAKFSLPNTLEAAWLYEAIGEYHLQRHNFLLAKRALDYAINRAPGVSRLHHRRGDTLKLLSQDRDATTDFVAATKMPGSSVWAHIHAARGLADQVSSVESAIGIIKQSSSRFNGHYHWRQAAYAVLDKKFEAVTGHAIELYNKDMRTSADAMLTGFLDEAVKIIPMIDPLPTILPEPNIGYVLMIANRDLPQCDYYRVEQKRRLLRHGGWSVEILNYSDLDSAKSKINEATIVIFYRVPATIKIISLILYAQGLGIKTIYEIDDLIFDATYYPDPFETFENQISNQEHIGLQYGVPLFRYAIRLCDAGLASTPALADAIRPLVRSGICHVLRNGFDERHLRFLERPQIENEWTNAITIFYGSGTKAHNKDFNDLVGPALLNMLEIYPNVRIVIAGYLSLDNRFLPYAKRIRQLGFSSKVESYWEVLSLADINLAVLAPSTVADAKSELKWLEAAMFAIPSVVSDTRTYREILKNGDNVFMASTVEDWSQALRALISDPLLRCQMGARARACAESVYAMENGVETLRAVLPSPVSPELTSASTETIEKWRFTAEQRRSTRTRARILIVNVYFPPQSIGGATRVAQSNVDELIDRYAEMYDLAIVATDDNTPIAYNFNEKYNTRVDNYRGVPVYRVCVPSKRNMDWQPFDSLMAKFFEVVIKRFDPDLVHFHCVQRLTAAGVDIAKAYGVPYVITLHDAWWISDYQFLIDNHGLVKLPSADLLDYDTDVQHHPIESIARRIRLGELLDGAHELLAVSKSFADIYRKAGFDQVRTVANGVPELVFSPRTMGNPSQVRLGHIGGRTTHKGATLIEVALRRGRYPNLYLTMVDHSRGDGYRREEMWGQTNVEIIGFVPQDRISCLYSRLDVLLAPSIWPESFGLVSREAHAAGLWVIASDRGAIGEDIDEGVDGFRIAVDDLDMLASVLVRINADPVRFGRSPSQWKQEIRTMADQADDLVQIYNSVLVGRL